MSEAPEDWARIKELAADALELPPEARAAFVHELSRESDAVRAGVQRLLASAEATSAHALEDGLAGEAVARLTRREDLAGQTIGGFRILRFVARGGMGEVWEAEQTATGRRVALKLLAGRASRAWRARFRHEVEILARLEHPAIAQVLDADVDPDGERPPYLALEYVDGLPLTVHARTQGLNIEERIALLLEVCAGVQHAHQRGVIHRDLKPENILVAKAESDDAQDARDARRARIGQPKVLDFGVARVLEDDSDDVTQLTRQGELIGTLSYMSPEQLSGVPQAVDSRTDVYGLGVLLFELFTGRLPVDVSGASLPEAIARLRERPAPPPSTIDATLRGDLDTICAAALAHDPEERYQSVSELAADLRRFLAREPLAARPASRMHQLRLFARRHRGLVAGLAATLLALVAGATTTTIGFVQASAEARRANAESERTRAANAFLGEVLSASDPELLGRDATMRDALDLHAPRIDAAFAEDPRTRAELHATAGWTYYNLGERERARTHLATARDLYRELDGPDSAEALGAERLFWTVDHELDGTSEASLDAARELVERTTAALGPLHEDTLGARSDHAYVLSVHGRFDEALALARDARDDARGALGDEAETTQTLTMNLGVMLLNAGAYDEAAALFTELHALRAASLGEGHPKTIQALVQLASADSMAERSARALASFDRALEAARTTWDEGHPMRLRLLSNRASALSGLGRFDEAIADYEDVHRRYAARFGPQHDQTLRELFNLGVTLAYAERKEEAAVAARAVLSGAETCEGCEDDLVMRASGLLASLLSELGRTDEAVPLQRRALEEHRRLLGPGHFQTLIQANNFARTLATLERYDESLPLFEETLALWQEEYPSVPSIERTFRWNYARALHDAGQLEEAVAELRRVDALGDEADPDPRPSRAELLERLAIVYDALGRPEEAATTRSLFEEPTTNAAPR